MSPYTPLGLAALAVASYVGPVLLDSFVLVFITGGILVLAVLAIIIYWTIASSLQHKAMMKMMQERLWGYMFPQVDTTSCAQLERANI